MHPIADIIMRRQSAAADVEERYGVVGPHREVLRALYADLVELKGISGELLDRVIAAGRLWDLIAAKFKTSTTAYDRYCAVYDEITLPIWQCDDAGGAIEIRDDSYCENCYNNTLGGTAASLCWRCGVGLCEECGNECRKCVTHATH